MNALVLVARYLKDSFYRAYTHRLTPLSVDILTPLYAINVSVSNVYVALQISCNGVK